MFARAARTLGLVIVGMATCAVDLEAGGQAKDDDAPSINREQIPSPPAKVVREQIPTLPAKVAKEQILTLPAKVVKEQILTLPARVIQKEEIPTPPAKKVEGPKDGKTAAVPEGKLAVPLAQAVGGKQADGQLPAKKSYKLGPDSLVQEGVPLGKLEGPLLFRSKVFEGTVRQFWIYVPVQYQADKPACVLVFQDGQRAVNPKGALRVPTVMDNLIHKHEMPVTIGIFITPGHFGEDYPKALGLGNPKNRAVEYDSLGDKYARFLIDEMLPEVGKRYNLTRDPAGRAIGGASSGAICAFTVAWERPDAFRKVISLIGSFTDIRGGHVYPELVKKSDKKPMRVYIQDGINDNRNAKNPKRDWHLQNKAMVAALEEKGYDMTHVFGEGGHSDDHGGALLPEILRWMWRDYQVKN